jgi:glycosyltransferase involved in cell wall biosynthesis
VSGLDVEILLIDDGSTDPASIRCLYQMADTFPEITVLRTPNQGLAKTRNYGATHAHGTYLAFLDADDTVDPDYYPRALAILRHYDNVSFVGSWTQYRGESNEIWMTWNPEPPYILFRNAVNSSALVYRRQDFLEYGLNDPEFRYGYEDYESVVRMVSHQRAGVIIPELLFIYLARPNSMSHAFTNEMELYLHSLIVKKNPALYHQYGPELTQIINANWPHYTNDNPSSPF